MAKRYGIIADIHSNIRGLLVALAAVKKEGVDEIICLGDIGGYGARPSECVDKVYERCSHVIQGNHDRYILGEIPDGLRDTVSKAAKWGRKQLSSKQLALLKKSPETDVVDNLVLMVHGSPRNRDEYLLSRDAIVRALKSLKTKYQGLDVCFYGHTHLPCLIGDGKIETDFKEKKTVQLKRLTRYLINPGSCGQPRDGCTLAACGVFDANDWTMTFLRAEYDLKAVQKEVRDAKLDPWFADRLEVGR